MYTSSNAVLPATGAVAGLALWGWVGALCLVVGLFAVLAASGAAWRLVPAPVRRGLDERRRGVNRR